MTLPTNLTDLLSVRTVGPEHYVSTHSPRAMGNRSGIAYGGNTTGVAVFAAHMSVPEGYYIFSVLGSFLGPTRVDRELYCRVSKIRDTKTFSTRRVIAYQIQEDKSERNCLEVTVDFHVREQSMFEYGAKPPASYFNRPEDPTKTATVAEMAQRLLERGELTQNAFEAWNKSFTMANNFLEARSCLEAVNGQNFNGGAKAVQTTQDHLPITEKSCAEWFRTRQPLQSLGAQAAALCFWMDGALSFLPLTMDHKDLTDAGACSTLDFALRVFVPSVSIDKWHLRERRTIAAQVGRTYSEARLWNEKGDIVAVMTQTNICRPPAKKPQMRAAL